MALYRPTPLIEVYDREDDSHLLCRLVSDGTIEGNLDEGIAELQRQVVYDKTAAIRLLLLQQARRIFELEKFTKALQRELRIVETNTFQPRAKVK